MREHELGRLAAPLSGQKRLRTRQADLKNLDRHLVRDEALGGSAELRRAAFRRAAPAGAFSQVLDDPLARMGPVAAALRERGYPYVRLLAVVRLLAGSEVREGSETGSEALTPTP